MVPSCVLTCQVSGKTHTHAKHAGWFSAHCCVFALFAAQAPGLSVMATEPSCGEQTESWYLLKSRSCWKWDCLLCPACCTPAFPSASLLGGCMHHGSADIFLNSSVRLTAFLSTYFRVWHHHCVFNEELDLFALGDILSCNGTPCWKHTLADATCSTSTPSALSHRAQCLYAQAKNLGPAFPNFRVDLGVATSQLII